MTLKEQIELLEKEIDWCLEHPATNLSKQFQTGFVAGIQQAIYLLVRKNAKLKINDWKS